MAQTLSGIVIGFLLLAALIGPLERLWPSVRRQATWRRGFATDLAYWLFTPLVTRWVTRAGVIGAVLLLAFAAGVPFDRAHFEAWASQPGRLVGGQPRWLQILEVLVLGDLIGYWTHRLFHARMLWRFHAVHHCSTEVDWLSSVRLHPVNDVASRAVAVLPIALAGFPLTILAGYVPFLTFYAILLHANLPWTFGPLRYALASPAFHRWHHTSEEEGMDKNFAGLFPWVDLLFGTFYMPKGRQPAEFGIRGERVPETLWGQLAYPFRR